MISVRKWLVTTFWNNILKESPAPSSNHSNNETLVETTCQPWRVPHWDIRLQVTQNTIRIYGHPSQLPYATFGPSLEFPGPSFLYLRGDVPAYVDYIMGSDWRGGLTTAEGFGGEVIFRTPALTKADTIHCNRNLTELWHDDEEQHCLRMRRCGAVVLWSETEVVMRDTPYYGIPPQHAERQVFGWPKAGGVWILRKPSSGEGLTLEEAYERLMSDPDGLEGENYTSALADMRKAKDMEALCDVLKHAGGQYYADAADCPEAWTLGLSNAI